MRGVHASVCLAPLLWLLRPLFSVMSGQAQCWACMAAYVHAASGAPATSHAFASNQHYNARPTIPVNANERP